MSAETVLNKSVAKSWGEGYRAGYEQAQQDSIIGALVATKVRIHRAATTAREYDAITVWIADLPLSADIVSDRQIMLAKKLADSHGAVFQVSPELQGRVDAALVAMEQQK